jgi:signal transduction histidine kinase
VRESDPFQAIELLKESEQICVEHDIIRVLNVLYGGLFNVYNAIGKKKEAMEVALKVLALGERQGNKQTIVQGQQNIGTVHLAMGNYEEAEDYFLQSLEIAESTKYTAGIYRANGSLAIVYEGMKMYEKAVPYYKGSIKLLEDLSYYSELPENYGNLAGCYLEMAQLDSAFACLQKGASYVKDNTPVEMSILNAGYSNYYFQKENYQKAINYGEDAYAHSVEISLLKNTARILYESHKTKGNYAKALQYHEAYKQHQDSVFNQENIQNITRQELTYDFEKEKEVAALQQAQQEALLKAESRQARGIAIGVSILALLASVFLWNTRRQNKIIAQKNDQLEQLNQTKDHIFAVLGHDLRKPALSFRGITEKLHYLIEKQDFKTMNQLGAVLEQNALQLNTLLDNVLNWALTQKSAVTYTPKAIDANESVAETLQLFKGLATEKNIQLQSSIPNDLKLYVDTNSWAVILRNLVDNAIKFTPKGGTVELQAQPSPKGVHISVKDNGIGIAPENLKDIFVLKEQKSTRGTKGEKGTGLGLHLVQELVKINQGTINVQSQVQQGTTFNLLLPSV